MNKLGKIWDLLSGWILAVYAKAYTVVLTLSNPINCSPPGSSASGILQARIPEWVAMHSSRGSSQPRNWTHISYVFCTGVWIPYHLVPPGKPTILAEGSNLDSTKGGDPGYIDTQLQNNLSGDVDTRDKYLLKARLWD